MSVYKRVPEEWLKKQSPQKQHDVLKFLRRLKFWKNDNKPYMDGGLSGPTRHGKAIQSFIVGLEAHPFGQIDAELVANSHYELLAPYVGSIERAKKAIVYSYNKCFNGFAAMIDKDVAANIAQHPDVISVFATGKCTLQTTNSWGFLGLGKNDEVPDASLWQKTFGENIIIANVDTGVWPESTSFSDEEMGPIPARWRGICQTDKDNSDNFHCNRKLIGARYFFESYIRSGAEVAIRSPRDFHGHGTHTLSIAGGNFVDASVLGIGKGMAASGGLPKARVAAYKVSSFEPDILTGIDHAVTDGVDVISLSVNSELPREFIRCPIAIGTFNAVANGIIVVNSGGNFGPSPCTLTNVEPWTITVAASTTNRDFFSYVTLGNEKVLEGASYHGFGMPSGKFYQLIMGDDAKAPNTSKRRAMLCKEGSIDLEKAKGKILVCLLGGGFKDYKKSKEAARAGAVGLILINIKEDKDITIDDLPHALPTSQLNFKESSYILNYMSSTEFPTAHISCVKTKFGQKHAPCVAPFSARGPNTLDRTILKPDITAPGVSIIAAGASAKTPFVLMSGTSMACPHVAAVAGLIKSCHPDWSPAAVKSAIMTTATVEDEHGGPILESDGIKFENATPFAFGAGHLHPNRAVDPGLVYDLTIYDYLTYLWDRGYSSDQLAQFYQIPYSPPKSYNRGDFNYPSITIVAFDIGHPTTVSRTLTNVGTPSTYWLQIKAPPEVQISVHPQILKFEEKGKIRNSKLRRLGILYQTMMFLEDWFGPMVSTK